MSKSLWIGLVISLAFLALFVRTIDIDNMMDSLQGIKYRYIVFATVIYFVALFCRSMRWSYLLSTFKPIGARKLFPIMTVGYMSNNLLPARLGEIIRIYFLKIRESFRVSTALATIVIERTYDAITCVMIAAVCFTILVYAGALKSNEFVFNLPLLVSGIVIAFVFLIALICLILFGSKNKPNGILIRVSSIIPQFMRHKAVEFIYLFIDGLALLKSPSKHFKLFAWSLLIWVLEASVFFVVSLAFDMPGHFDNILLFIPAILLLTTVTNITTSIPALPGSIGIFEITGLQTLSYMGINSGLSGAFVIVTHLVVLVPVTLLGLIYLWYGNISLMNIMNKRDVNSNDKDPGINCEITEI
ncbi:flippase-like domain-containing protein [SAR202 cluster bacterium AC-409-J13_OGT_754m]|nr:flippase-like domain-containing protein [SAR202 cluster bacterium AC-409-J13_OGT_754m]